MPLPSIFISYKRKHDDSEKVVRKLEKELSDDFEVLRDVNIEAGNRWTKELYNWVLNCDAAIIVVSKAANKADWCRREWAVLRARWEVADLPVIPVCTEDEFFETGILDEIQGKKGLLSSDDIIAEIKEVLKDLESTKFTAKDFLAAHHAWLRWSFYEAPVFQREPYALGDVYIEPECGFLQWQKIQEKNLDPFNEGLNCGGRQQTLSSVLTLIGDPEFKDLIVIQAGPGAGKSAFTLHLANELIENKLQPILVRFRDLRFSQFSNAGELIDDAIRIGATDEESPHPDGEIIKDLLSEDTQYLDANICKTVIILDGWDEVSLTGNESFKAQLTTWLPQIREFFVERRGPRIRVVLTGRPSIDVTHSGLLRKATAILTMRPMRPDQLEKFATDISQRLEKAKRDCTLNDEQVVPWELDVAKLPPVFLHYQKWYMSASKAGPDSTGDILGNPLLAYLAFRVFGETEHDLDKLIVEPTALYYELINITAKYSGKGRDDKLENTVHHGGEGLRRLLQEVAATISILRVESVSYQELEARFKDPELPIPNWIFENWRDNVDLDIVLKELVVNFYFKGGNTDLGCEFLHKSFREYLFAEAIYNALLDVSTDQQFPYKCKNYQYWEDFEERSPEYILSRRLSYLIAPQWLSAEVRNHLFWLIEKGIREDCDRWCWIRGCVLEVYSWWAEGAMIRHQPTRSRRNLRWNSPFVDELFQQIVPFDESIVFVPIRTSILDSHLGHALLQITAHIFHTLSSFTRESITDNGRSGLYHITPDESVLFRPGGGGFFRYLINRIDTEGWKTELGVSSMILPSIYMRHEDYSHGLANGANLYRAKFSDTNLFSAHFNKTNLAEASFKSANLVEANFIEANLTEADLRKVDLSRADIRAANLSRANLWRANLIETNLSRANLTEANLVDADLKGTKLRGADLTKADLAGVDLKGAILQGADFSDSFLRATNFTGVDLAGVNLSGARLEHAALVETKLDGANLMGADLRNADLYSSSLIGANLIGADLENADLTGANLTGADLTRANLRGANLRKINLTDVIGYDPN